MTIIEIEDSLGEDLGLGLQDTLTDVPEVKFAPLAIGDTGLADLAYYNWPRALAYDLAECHPAIVIVFLGGNDCQPVRQWRHQRDTCCPRWDEGLRRRLLREGKRADVRGHCRRCPRVLGRLADHRARYRRRGRRHLLGLHEGAERRLPPRGVEPLRGDVLLDLEGLRRLARATTPSTSNSTASSTRSEVPTAFTSTGPPAPT